MFKIHSASSSLFSFHEISSCEIKTSLVANCMILSLRKHSPKFGGWEKTKKNHIKSPDFLYMVQVCSQNKLRLLEKIPVMFC